MAKIGIVKRNTLAEQIMDNIKDYIVCNNFGAGERLPSERRLAEEMGVSRTILREALKSLAAVGILEIRGGAGIYVGDADYLALMEHLTFSFMRNPLEFRYLAKARLIFEVGAIEDAIENADADDFIRILKICSRLENAKSVGEHVTNDREFHKELVAMTHNPLLVELSSFFDEFFAKALPTVTKDVFPANADSHRRIVNAVKEKDMQLAKDLVKEHIYWYAQLVKLDDQ